MPKRFIAGLLVASLAALATPAHGYVAEVATSIAASTLDDDDQLAEAVLTAITDVLKRAIAFTPSLVQLQDVKRAGDRVYLLLLIADREGEETLKAFVADQPDD